MVKPTGAEPLPVPDPVEIVFDDVVLGFGVFELVATGGGGFAEIGELLRYPIAKGLSLYGLPQLVSDCEIKISTLGDKSTMLGAYALVMENVFI